MTQKTFTVNGMRCMHCKASVEQALKGLKGVESAEVSLENKNVTVSYDEAAVSPEQMQKAVAGAGNFEMEL